MRTVSTKGIRALAWVPKEKGGGTSAGHETFLSSAAIDILGFRRPRVFKHQDGAGRVVVECHMCATIAMN
jgi:hypothetical protein